MIRRLALLALCVIALMTTPGVRADVVARGAQRIAPQDERVAIQGASGRQSLQPERRGGTSRHAAGKNALLWLVSPPLLLRPEQPQTSLPKSQDPELGPAIFYRAARARAPPSVA